MRCLGLRVCGRALGAVCAGVWLGVERTTVVRAACGGLGQKRPKTQQEPPPQYEWGHFVIGPHDLERS